MKKRVLGLLLLAFLPTIVQFIVEGFGSYSLGLITRIIVHLVVPVIAVSYVTKIAIKDAWKIPLRLKNKKRIIKWGIIGGFGTTLLILILFFSLKHLIDFSIIAENLALIGVTKLTYPFVALAIVLINPFIEEYFWRGFVFRGYHKYYPKIAYLTGILFALHHVIMLDTWFNWWQFTIIAVALALVGVLFNWIYVKTESIYTAWFMHMLADLIIVTIGFFMVF